MRTRFAVLTAAVACLGLPSHAQQGQQPDLNALMGALGSMMQANTNAASAAKVVDFRELKALLPADLPDMKRTAASGEKSGAMGMTVSFAEGRYEGANNAYITLKISDMGGTGFAGMMSAGWSMTEVDRETETGYERTTTVGGHKAMEKFDTKYKTGSLEILVAGRFLVEIDASKVEPAALQAAAGKVDLKKLESMK